MTSKVGKVAPEIRVSAIHIYPVKALRGYPVEEAVVEPRGFRGDRRFMIVTPDGDFLTQRDCHAMAPIQARLEGGQLTLQDGRGERSCMQIDLDAGLNEGPGAGRSVLVRVWDSRVMADLVGPRADRWLSEALGRDVRLVFMPETTRRSVDPKYDTGGDIVSFADGYPYLGIGDESVAALNERMAAPVSMERFRPNLTFSGGGPFAEDDWKTIRVGPAVFRNVKPCARCVVTTIDPDLGVAGSEPLATMATFRRRDGQVFMGANLVPVESGVVRVGDPVTVLE